MVVEHEPGIKDAIEEAVAGAEDNVVVGVGEAEEVGEEEEVVVVGKRDGA